MKFWDREKEKEWLKHYLQTEPNAILFVYGPKSSGKTTLLMKVVEELPKDSFVYYWYDLRERVISSYDSVLKLFFRPKGWLERMRSIAKSALKIPLGVFELDIAEIDKVIRGDLDAFEEMRAKLEMEKDQGKIPVIVFDELQKLKEVYLNGDSKQRPLVRELFNFFVRITKVLHLAHVIVMTSDTFFIEQVYTDSTLKNTSRFYLVDFFDDETAKKILISEGLSEQDAQYVVDWIGGVPWMIEEVLESDEPVEEVKRLYTDVKGSIGELLGDIYEQGWYDEAKHVLTKVMDGSVEARGKDRELVRKLVEMELLFYDPVKGKVRFHSKLDERAVREFLGAI